MLETGLVRYFALAIAVVVCLVPDLSSAAARPRIAAAMELATDFRLPAQFGQGAAIRALAQGVREACLEPASQKPRPQATDCSLLQDAPASLVCIDETATRALTIEIKCGARDATAEAIDLSRSGCDTAACFMVEARRAGATHLLMVAANWKDGLALAGILTDLADGKSTTLTPQNFEKKYNSDWPRSGPQVLGLLKWFARETAVAVLVHDATAGTAIKQARVIPAAPPIQSAYSSRPSRWVGWTLVGTGGAAGVGSWLFWRQDKNLVSCASVPGDVDPCRRQHRTILPALALGAGAVGAILAGSVVLVRRRPGDEQLTLIVDPSGLSLGGTF
jgi:hypothetical protein